MSFRPVLPFGGYAGWKFLTRTMDTQKAAFAKSPQIQRDTAYFKDRIAAVKTAEDLVADRRLLRVALGAFGLEGDINNTYFVKKVLSDGTLDQGDLANRLADKRYLEMSKAFGFGDYSVPSTQLSSFPDKIATAYEERQFEVAVGEADDTMRLALNARRELAELAGKGSTEDTKWYSVLGSGPLRQVFTTAFGLPSSFGQANIDRQLATLKDKAETLLGADTVSQFAAPERVEALVRLFTLRAGAQDSGGRAGAALSLLQSAGRRGLSLRV